MIVSRRGKGGLSIELSNVPYGRIYFLSLWSSYPELEKPVDVFEKADWVKIKKKEKKADWMEVKTWKPQSIRLQWRCMCTFLPIAIKEFLPAKQLKFVEISGGSNTSLKIHQTILPLIFF